ncbi:hypothetical protein ORJ66_02630 [Pseudoalteromonas tunicata]|uniref:hypothetical protein n=1 Tax=Pseudoalteromonas tunicata TaxID=314281 RepID=UPI00274001D8|nr:hypothetical protein [Pseudoalteromonas tunicata]MDP5211938.1 hypothetical protein [Pseudoalteromonas tunicata]
MPSWYLDALNIMGSSLVLFLIPAAAFYYYTRDKLSFRFTVITMIFFFIGITLDMPIRNIDQGLFIYRYLIWAALDITWMAVIAYWALKDKVHLWQSIVGQLVVVFAPLLQLFRLLDRHLWDLSYSDYLYQTLLPIINIATIAVCYLPVFYFFFNKKKPHKQLAN